ncbi:Root UVB sensitive family protein [Dioscorea alata]|uniref:Root UVB sensitive family protein n=1 Tax=Dioscorea alata TaxID=55571 RepID=A0ACB7VAI4_DIOAL|nr:Root UVB sensitive family protein [Dioscorea alata]
MAPISLKRPSTPSQNLTLAGASEARSLVRDAMRTTLASPPVSPPLAEQISPAELRFGPALDGFAVDGTASRILCCEEVDGRRWSYVADVEPSGRLRTGSSLKAVALQNPVAPIDELVSFIRSYVVPEGFPDSVTPSYVPYMTWRALKHFFGGAMGVFTTQTLLSSVGVSRNQATSGAVAINWILKDGAGRVGKMLFARQGKKFDYDLKQLRFAGDLLMELGAGVELATAAVPHLFLPLACAANVAKNVAAVTSTSTRTPIYKAYARGENIGDVTAKGESVGNIADLVKSVVLNTLNRARFTVAVESFLKTGCVPSLKEGNLNENIFTPPWSNRTPIVLGPRFGDAFQEPASFLAIERMFENERYIVTYNPAKGNIYALFKDQAKSEDILKAAFHAHVLLHCIRSSKKCNYLRTDQSTMGESLSNHLMPKTTALESHIVESCDIVSSSFRDFKEKAAQQGWIMSDSLLNPGRARLYGLTQL